MGINNRQRRAARRRKHRGAGDRDQQRRTWSAGDSKGSTDRASATHFIRQVLVAVAADGRSARTYAELLYEDRPLERSLAADVLHGLLREFVSAVVASGWSPYDLAEIIRRRLPAALPALAVLVRDETDKHPAGHISTRWRAEVDGLGSPQLVDLVTIAGLEQGLRLAAVLIRLPVIAAVVPPPGPLSQLGETVMGTDAKLLSRVRALLAKAESTEYAEEAEVLSAKAQELISRYSLDRLLHESDPGGWQRAVVSRRLWIDPPYVVAKAQLIQAVASANRCRAVLTEELGFSTLIGELSDLEAVELLVTSLLVQGNSAMLSYGRRMHRDGASRTTSFRRSFLVSYAQRIGERLAAASRDAADQVAGAGALLPALRRHDERVDAAFQRLFPGMRTRASTVSDAEGWAAGRAAADLARLDRDLPMVDPRS